MNRLKRRRRKLKRKRIDTRHSGGNSARVLNSESLKILLIEKNSLNSADGTLLTTPLNSLPSKNTWKELRKVKKVSISSLVKLTSTFYLILLFKNYSRKVTKFFC